MSGLTLSKLIFEEEDATDIDPAKIAGGEREKGSANVARRARSALGRARLYV